MACRSKEIPTHHVSILACRSMPAQTSAQCPAMDADQCAGRRLNGVALAGDKSASWKMDGENRRDIVGPIGGRSISTEPIGAALFAEGPLLRRRSRRLRNILRRLACRRALEGLAKST